MAYDLARLEQALVNADKAGDVDAAKAFATEIRKMRAPQPPASNPATGGNTLQVYNPFGKNFDTGIDISENVQNYLAGAGKFFSDAGTAAKQMVGAEGADQEAEEARRLDQALMQTKAGIGGNLTGALATAAPLAFVPGANTLAGSAAAGALQSALQPTVGDESRLGNMALGGALSGGVHALGKGIGIAAKGAKQQLSAYKQGLAAKAENLGAQLTTGKKLGSNALQKMEASFESHPATAAKYANIKSHNQALLNKFGAEAIGETGESLSDDVIGQAFNNIGAKFDAAKGSTISLGKEFASGVQAAKNKYVSVVGGRGDNTLNGIIDDSMALAKKGVLTGDDYIKNRSALSAMSRDAYRQGNSRLAKAVDEVIDSFDDAAQRSIPGASKQLKEARQQWRMLSVIKDARNGENLSAAKLAGKLSKNDPKGFTRGDNQGGLYTMVRFGKNFPDVVGDSGTATRQSMQQMVGRSLGGSLLGGAAGGAYDRSPESIAMGVLMGAAAPYAGMKLASGAYSGPVSKMLMRQPMPRAEQLANLLKSPAVTAQSAGLGSFLLGADPK